MLYASFNYTYFLFDLLSNSVTLLAHILVR